MTSVAVQCVDIEKEHHNTSSGTTAISAEPVPLYSTIAVSAIATSGGNTYRTTSDGSATNNAQGVQNQRARPLNHWADSICDWPTNIFPSCWCACCCFYGMYLVAQISQKTGYSSFRRVMIGMVFVWILSFILQLAIGAAIILWLPLLISFFFTIMLRLHMVRTYQIMDCGNTGPLGEFCCGFWCWYCSIAQMARHAYGYTKVFDGDSDPNRPDNYGPQTV